MDSGGGAVRIPGDAAGEAARDPAGWRAGDARGQPPGTPDTSTGMRPCVAVAVAVRVNQTGGNRPSFGLGRYQTGPNSKFKFEFKKMKNS